MMIFQDKSFGERPEIRDQKTEMAKLEENVNFQMYFKDYWNIRYILALYGTFLCTYR